MNIIRKECIAIIMFLPIIYCSTGKYQSVHFKVITATKRYYAEIVKVSNVSLNLTLGTHISMNVHSLKLDKLKAMCENSRFL